MMNKNPKNSHYAKINPSRRALILLAVLTVLVGGISCNVPLALPGLGISGQDPIAELEDQGLLNVTEISAGEEKVVIQYENLLEEDLELMVSGWLAAFQAAGKAHPEAERIILKTNSLGEPYLELTALNSDVQALIEDLISSESFLERLVVLDQRPPETKLFEVLTELGHSVSKVDLDGGTVVIEMIQDPVENEAALFSIWWSIGAAVIEESVPASRIQIRSIMPDSSTFVVLIEMADLEAYLAEEITPLIFLASVEISEEPALVVEE